MAEKLIIDASSFSKGIVPGKSATPQYAPEGFASFGYGVTLKRMQGSNYLTAIQPQEGITNVTDYSTPRINGLVRSMAVDSAGEVFAALSTGRVVNFGVSDNTIATGDYRDISPPSSTITTCYDTQQYSVYATSALEEYTLVSYTYNIGQSWAIARRKKSDNSWVDNWTGSLTLSGNTDDAALESGIFKRPYIWQGPDGLIYVCNGRWVAQHTPGATTMNVAALNIGYGFRTISGTSYGNYSAILSVKIGTASVPSYGVIRVSLWDGYSSAPNFVYEIDDTDATAIRNDNGRLLVFTNGKNGTYKIWQFNGNAFQMISESYLLGPWSQEHIEMYDGALLYSTDSTYLNELRGNALFSRLYRNANISALKNATSSTLYVGYYQNSTYRIGYLNNSDYYSEGSTYIVSRVLSLPSKSTIRKVRAVFANYVDGAKCEVFIGKGLANPITSPAATSTFSNTTYANLSTSLSESNTITVPDVTSFTVGIRFNNSVADTTKAVALERVEVEYEPTPKP